MPAYRDELHKVTFRYSSKDGGLGTTTITTDGAGSYAVATRVLRDFVHHLESTEPFFTKHNVQQSYEAGARAALDHTVKALELVILGIKKGEGKES